MLKQFVRQPVWLSLALLSLMPFSLQSREEKGEFIIYQSGGQIGRDSYQIRPEGDAWVLAGEVTLSLPQLQLSQKPVLKLDSLLEPTQFFVQATTNGKNVTVSFTFANGTASIQTRTNDRTRNEDVAYPEGAVLLANNVFHHMLILVRKYYPDKGKERSLTVFPNIPATIADKGEDEFQWRGKPLRLRRLFITIGGRLAETVWIDHAKRIIRLSVPAQSLEVALSGYEQIVDQTGKPVSP
jgi:hypothetical protein